MSCVKYLVQKNMIVLEILQESLDLTNIVRVKKDVDDIIKEIDLRSIVRVIINMEHVKYIDSSGIGILISIKKRFQTDIYLKNAAQNVSDVIKLTSLDQMFHIE